MKSFKHFLAEQNCQPFIGLLHKCGQGVCEDLTQHPPQPVSDHPDSDPDVVQKKHQALAQHYSKYTDFHKSAIRSYTGSHSRTINPALHDGKEHELRGNFHNTINNLDDALKAHTTPHDMTVYSGIKWHPENLPKHGEDFHAHQKAFTSTSINPNVATGFGTDDYGKNERHVLQIHVPKGSHGGYVDHHSKYGSGMSGDDHHSEKEFVLPRNSKLTIHPHPTTTVLHKTFSQTKVHVWKATLTHDGTKEVGGKE